MGNREEGADAAFSVSSDAAARKDFDEVLRLDALRAGRSFLEELLMEDSSRAFR
jgi:hypothetical protein